MKKKYAIYIVCLTALTAFAAGSAVGQADHAIRVEVLDPAGMAIHGAVVVVTPTATGTPYSPAYTDAAGKVEINELWDGNYRVIVEARNFKKSIFKNINLRPTGARAYELIAKLEIGSGAVEIDVGPDHMGPGLHTTQRTLKLELTIAYDHYEIEHTGDVELKFTFINAGKQDLLLALGPSGYKMPDAIDLILDDANGRIQRLNLMRPSGVASGIGWFRIPVNAGGSYSISQNLSQYLNPGDHAPGAKLSAGTYSVQAEFTGTDEPPFAINRDNAVIRTVHCWVGKVTSNPIQIVLSAPLATTSVK
jgi:hypothetical protein